MSYAVAGKIAGLGYYGQGRGPRPGSPYLYSGIRGLGRLGDASYDAAVSAYTADHAAWVQEQTAYGLAVQAYSAAIAQQSQAYAQASAGYSAALATWQAQNAAYQQALTLAEGASRGQAINYASAQAAAQKAYPQIIVPAAGPYYPGCVTQAQSDAWAATCRSSAVKGFGAVPTGPECGLAMLPVCGAQVAFPNAIGPQPTPPSQPPPPLPPAPLRPEPQPPAAPAPAPLMMSTPASVPASYPTTDALDPGSPASSVLTPAPTPAATSAGLLSNGLLLVVLAGGSYALYRTLRKPRRPAA